ncbi:M23 family metallopeptidase [Candidatus Daviesbacteria bacterium]|nr:M23 family metallopeptidase [Candidatus Daviesbacteria bacterium]MBI4038465.1 M23 family metallopeptidase [Candidatus Daviesbacteria bacterium]
MKRQVKNLLPMIISERVALTQKLSKISLRFPKRLQWLIIIFLFFLNFLGYYPTFSIPPVKKHLAKAQTSEQKGEVISKSFSKPLNLPHPGFLTTKFSNWHPGIDIAAGLGMPVRPIIDGEVIKAGVDFFGLGNYVEISHQNGFNSKYAHLGKIYVKKGDKVTSDNLLGEVGLSGRTSGAHTHLEITLNGDYIDPQTILPEISDLPIDFTKK